MRLMRRTQAFGHYARNFMGLSERLAEPELAAKPDLPRERLWQMRAREVVLATGAIECPLVFADNDRPGIMLADAARRYLNQYGVKIAERVVVVTAHDGAYRAALDLKDAGVHVDLIADLREDNFGPLPEAARAAGLRVATRAAIHEVQGRGSVTAVRLAAHPFGMRTFPCDALPMSGGWTPSVHLFSQSRGKLAFDEALQVFRPEASVQREWSAGACNAAFGLGEALAEGYAAGHKAAAAAGFAAPEPLTLVVEEAPPASGGTLGAPLHILGDRCIKAFVDYQNDVCVKDVELAVQEGMRSIEHVKRYTTTGMATDQGKLSNVGQDTDGTVTQADLGLDWAIGKTKKDFVGKRSLSRRDMLKDDREQLVGLITEDPNVVLKEGAQITATGTPAVGSPAVGHVTSSYRSATLGRSIALALVAAGRSRMGAKLFAPMPSGAVAVTITAPPVFYDKDGAPIPGLPRASPSTTSCCLWGRDFRSQTGRRRFVSSSAAAKRHASFARRPSTPTFRASSDRREKSTSEPPFGLDRTNGC